MLETVESRPVPFEPHPELTVTQLFDLSSKVAIVTGGSRGLGKEMADGLGEVGATVVITARRRRWLDPALEDLRSRGIEAMAIAGDTANEEDVKRIIAETVATYGRLDILVNNAGIAWEAPATEYPLEKWRQVINVNLTGVWLMSQHAARQMIAAGRGGRIVNNASIMGLVGADPVQHDTVSYNASKAGVIGLTRDLAVKWARYNILVNAIAPGYFPIRMTALLPDEGGTDHPRYTSGPFRPIWRAQGGVCVLGFIGSELYHRTDDCGGRWPYRPLRVSNPTFCIQALPLIHRELASGLLSVAHVALLIDALTAEEFPWHRHPLWGGKGKGEARGDQ